MHTIRCPKSSAVPSAISNLGRVIGSYAHSLIDISGLRLATGQHALEGSSEKRCPMRKRTPRLYRRSNEQRRLYFVLADKKAIGSPVSVGRIGKQWQGRAEIDGHMCGPAWSEMKRENPTLPSLIPGGAPNNPVGFRALTLRSTMVSGGLRTTAMGEPPSAAMSFGDARSPPIYPLLTAFARQAMGNATNAAA